MGAKIITKTDRQMEDRMLAVANDPVLLLADEMVSALDTTTAGLIVDEVFNNEMAVLFVTHDTALADRAPRRLTVHDREVVAR